MNEFIRHESMLPNIPTLLATRVSGFRESPEYRKLREYELDLPGVVSVAFGEYLARIYLRQSVERDPSAIRLAIVSAHEAIEALASSPETAVRNLITDELFETFERQPDVLDKIKSDLKPNALALYTRWMAPK